MCVQRSGILFGKSHVQYNNLQRPLYLDLNSSAMVKVTLVKLQLDIFGSYVHILFAL